LVPVDGISSSGFEVARISFFQSINVYPLIPLDEVLSNKEEIGEILFDFKATGHASEDNDVVFDISPVSGFIHFANYSLLWKNKKPGYSNHTAEEMEQIALRFMRDKNRLLTLRGLPPMFPSNPRRLEIVSAGGDHWLCRFTAILQTGLGKNDTMPGVEEEKPTLPPISKKLTLQREAQVLGCVVEVRINEDKTIIGLISYWRPCNGRPMIAQAFPPPILKALNNSNAEKARNGGNGDAENSQDVMFNYAELCYIVNSDGAPQKYLAPSYILYDSVGEATILPASPYSLIIEIEENASSDGKVLLRAIVMGRNGPLDEMELRRSFEFTWISWQLDLGILETSSTDGPAEIFQQHGEREFMILEEKGSYNVILRVIDRLTQTESLTQKLVYLGDKKDEPQVAIDFGD
jgi:hypothetical protein